MDETIIARDKDESVLDVLRLSLETEEFNVIPVMHCDDKILEMVDVHRLRSYPGLQLEGKTALTSAAKLSKNILTCRLSPSAVM